MLAQAATELLYQASGRRFPGVCTAQVWPRFDGTACSSSDVVELDTQWPVLSIVQVVIDGTVVDPDTYRIDDWGQLVRLADPAGHNPGWPSIRRNDRPHPDPAAPGAGTFSVTYTYGRAVPVLGRMAALALACHLRSWTAPVAELFGDDVNSLAFAGLSVSRESMTEAMKNGRTGIVEVDRFLAPPPLGFGLPAGKPIPVVGIWTPGLDASATPRRTWP